MSKKKIWFDRQENETLEDCFERIQRLGYTVVARREKPLFEQVGEDYIPVKQLTQFQAIKNS
ncbi:NETI motif-containing protein [Sporosarcina sp. PTS2304]|uniref:NETI motif-containing protein n=1 Tax=Sporosarcina sp. PTS2304 TaxID=2283194 RepID=UPI000E0CDF82|nr:NETI motif-containing protein [Sporosarcina sp. PTS2304]AXI00074.1 NETI motif-containing protein [Sporosarcina sp. PTS2304]